MAMEKDYIGGDVAKLEGSDYYYNMFESQITLRDMHDPRHFPNDRFKNIFNVHLIKDYAMGHYINKLLDKD